MSRPRPSHRFRSDARRESRRDRMDDPPAQNSLITAFFAPSAEASPRASPRPPGHHPHAAHAPPPPSPATVVSSASEHSPPRAASPPSYPPGQRDALRAVCQDTLTQLPGLLRQLGTEQDARDVVKLNWDSFPRLDPLACPSFAHPTAIRVVSADTLNAAIRLAASGHGSGSGSSIGSSDVPPLVVNFANRHTPGGGWRNGAMAQEEAICYRSSLALSLRRRYYPLATSEILYSPYVLIMRGDHPSGHALLSGVPPTSLPVVSVVTVAALRDPGTRELSPSPSRGHHDHHDHHGHHGHHNHSNSSSSNIIASHFNAPAGAAPPRLVFARDRDRAITKAKMRLTLRVAAANGHDQLVLGALGCGVFRNPPEDVARCWLEVLREPEFGGAGHWWRDVVFAVYDGHAANPPSPHSTTNYGIFYRILNGREV